MGKTPKPLVIMVHPSLMESEQVEALRAKGHNVQTGWLGTADLILCPNCFRIMPGMEKYIDVAVKGARAIKYPPKPKKEVSHGTV